MSLTPERIEEIRDKVRNHKIKTQMESNGIILSLLAALKEAQQALVVQEDTIKFLDSKLYEARHTIARKQLYIEKLQLSRESAQKAADNISKEKGLELFEARQTIARQSAALGWYELGKPELARAALENKDIKEKRSPYPTFLDTTAVLNALLARQAEEGNNTDVD